MQKLPELIGEAQRTMVRRARELFALPSNNLAEEQAIDSGLHMLPTLHRCVARKAA